MKKIRFNTVIITGLFLFSSIYAQAQKSKIGTWKAYPAYQDAVLVAETPNRVFCVYKGFYNDGKNDHNDGVLFSYSPEDKEIITYSFADGLSDVGITQMAYAPEAKALILIYENSNIDLFYGRNNVANISSIKDNFPQYTNKKINNIEIVGKLAYLSTGFGIVILDMERHEIKSEYSLNENTFAICRIDDYFYVATANGMKRAAVSSPNLKDIDNWLPFNNLNYEGDVRKITKMTVFKNQLVFFDSSKNRIYYYQAKEGVVKMLCNASCTQLSVINEQLTIVTDRAILFYTDLDKKVTTVNIAVNSVSSLNSKNIYWIARHNINGNFPDQQIGLAGIKRAVDEANYELITSGIMINSPLRNYIESMIYTADKLLAVGGGRSGDGYDRLLGTLMIYKDGKWINLDDQAIAKKTGLLYNNTPWCRSFVSVAVDPRDPEHYFVASYGEGIYEFQNNEYVKLHSHSNTDNALTSATSWYPELYVRTSGLDVDKNGNLYVVSGESQRALAVMTTDHKWRSFLYPPIAGHLPKQILIAKNNLKWVNIYKRQQTGIFVLDDNNTIDDISDDVYYFSSSFVDQQGVDIKASQYYSMAEDMNGTIWVGTDNGPISFSSADQVKRGVCNRIILSDQQDQGYRPLEGTFISAIAVDGANRKWMGSNGEGVFVLDTSGEKTKIENFTTLNSNLISNNISSIAIDNKTGEVFIGTDRGIVSYMSEVIEGMSDYSNVYAYPNPVNPASNNQVVITGLMANSTVKITDVAGNLINQGVSMGGQYTWNCANRTGNIVKAGIYLVLASLSDGSQGVVTKIMVIK